ncbi:MAG: glycosyltransferase family 2 protein [Lentisphaerales bacterium]|nr:MAG: glycosyltransferase family 2 protein [Lentisphaerales bacterium]
MKEDREKENFCAIIPAYREERMIGEVVRRVLKHVGSVIVVDDGSDDKTASEAENAGAEVIIHEQNKGKGVALASGFSRAREKGFDVAVVMDGDGQHDPEDVPRFIEAYVRTGIPVLVGNRMADLAHMPLVRKLTNRYMSWLLSRQMRQYVADTQCGYRLYRLDLIPLVTTQSERFAAESEILLNLASRGIRIDSVPIKAIYGDERSKINPLMDTVRFFRMLRRYSHHKS